MTFNDKHYKKQSPEFNIRLKTLLSNQNRLLNFIIKYLLATNGVGQTNRCETFIYIITKIRFNLECINSLFNLLIDDYRYKTTLNILYRSIVDDVINICYLLCFVSISDAQQKSLSNELNILHKEFLISIIELSEAQLEFNNYKAELSGLEKTSIADDIDLLKSQNINLFENGNLNLWKRNSDLRETTNQSCKLLFQQLDGTRNKFISEGAKLKVLESAGYKNIHQLKFLFKYFSQYQHYSPKTIDLVNGDIEFDIIAYQHTIGEIILSLARLFNVIKFDDLEILKAEWELLSVDIFNTFSD